MKKRILALLLCAALCFALLPAPALADENYNVWVAGTQVTSANMNDVLGATDGVGATVTYTPAVGTTPAVLTLNGANITGPAVEPLEDVSDSASGIYVSGGALTIHLIGANNVTKDGGSSWRNAIYSEAALTITAAKGASLTAEGKGGTDGNYGFSIKNSLTIEGGTITATGDAGSENATNGNHGICVVGGNLAITGGSVTAAAKGDATGDGSKSYGIFCDDGSINITNAIVNATGGSATTSSGGIWSENNLTIGNDATVTATGGEAAKTSTGLSCAEGGLHRDKRRHRYRHRRRRGLGRQQLRHLRRWFR